MGNRKSGIASLVLGFCAMYIPFANIITAILAIVFGSKAKNTDGKNLGFIGKLLGILSLIAIALSTIISIVAVTATIILNFLLIYLEMYA